MIQVDPDWWKALFDDIYLVTDARSVCNAELTRCEVKVIRKLLPIRPEDRILDLCGGHGRHSIELSRQGFRKITVVDYSESLLNIGAEEIKGNDTVREAAALLSASALNYVGFIEGSDLMSGKTDVVVTDGFTGNVLLKGAEGVARVIGKLIIEDVLNGPGSASRPPGRSASPRSCSAPRPPPAASPPPRRPRGTSARPR